MKVIFSTEDVHARDRLESWRCQASEATVAHDFKSRVGRAFKGSIGTGKLGPLELTLIDSGPCTVRRSKQRIAQAGDDDLLLNLQLAGSIALHQDGRDAVTRQNDLYLTDSRRPFSADVETHTRILIAKIPRRELEGRLGDVRLVTARAISNSAPMAALASGFLAMLPDRVSAIDAAAAPKVAQHVLDLVALAFGAELQHEKATLSSSRLTTLLRLKAGIEARLGEPGLRPAHAASAAGISVRYANALLRHEGMSLERFIMQRRLEHCRRALEDPAQATRTISDIAYSLGFSDMSHFTRRFRAEFGYSPSEFRQRALTSAPVLPQGA